MGLVHISSLLDPGVLVSGREKEKAFLIKPEASTFNSAGACLLGLTLSFLLVSKVTCSWGPMSCQPSTNELFALPGSVWLAVKWGAFWPRPPEHILRVIRIPCLCSSSSVALAPNPMEQAPYSIRKKRLSVETGSSRP